MRKGLLVQGEAEAEAEAEEEEEWTFCSMIIPKPVVVDSHVARVTMVAGPVHGVRRYGFTASYTSVD